MSLAAYACSGEFASDTDKIVYSNAYKRLAHKTQIIIKPTRDHFRSRGTHTEEVNQIALSMGRRLDLNLELITAIAKGHDLGHTPFGHAGERTLQLILERELVTRFNLKLGKKADGGLQRRDIFHHALNSARMLIKEKELEGVSEPVINGVLTHSWSPWKTRDDTYPVPRTYEAQVVAIADQIASINHDTEDIIEGEPYTEYDRERFSSELISEFKIKYPDSYNRLRAEVLSLIVADSIERGYGRQKRVEAFTAKIVESTLDNFKRAGVMRSDQARLFPTTVPGEWADLLRHYEAFIRHLIQERVSWFIARDNMAGAIVSTTFNHIWPRARASVAISQMKLPMYVESELVKTKYQEKTKYVEHFANFFNEHYIDEKKGTDFYREYLDSAHQKQISLWDTNVLAAFKEKDADKQRLLIRLIAVIDFIAGLTDRYSLEIFNEVFQEFVIT